MDNNTEYHSPTLKDISNALKAIKTMIVRRKYLLSSFVLVGALCGFLFATFSKPVYVAELTFVVEDEKSGASLGSAAGLASQFGIDLGSPNSTIFSSDNLIELLRSRYLIEKSLLQPDSASTNNSLADLYIESNHLNDKWKILNSKKKIKFGIDRKPYTRLQDSLLGTIYKLVLENNLAVGKIDKKLSLIEVRVKSSNELFSKQFAQSLVSTVSNFYINTKIKKEADNVKILSIQVDSVRHALNSSISGVAQSADYNPNPNQIRQVLHVSSQRRQIDVQSNTAILTELVKNLEIARIALRRETPFIKVIDNPILPLESKKTGRVAGTTIGSAFGLLVLILIAITKKIYWVIAKL